MTDNQKQWLIELYNNEIQDSIDAAKNEHIWALGSETNDEVTNHENNSEELKQYVEILKRLKENIQQI